jgi:hypothetical protein
MARLNTYAPEPFLVGQADGQSDISGRQNPIKFWRSPNGTEPIVILRATREVMEGLWAKGWHTGYSRDSVTGIDMGLRDLFSNKALSPAQFNEQLKNWINIIQGEVAAMDGSAICTLWHPEVEKKMITPLVKGKVVEIIAASENDAIRQLPNDIQTPIPRVIKVILLRSPRNVMEDLRNRGWHTGFWRDETTGLDKGICKLLTSNGYEEGRKIGLRQIVRMLDDEVTERFQNGIVTLWHDEITKDMVEGEDIQVMEIHATSAEEAVLKLKN